MIGWFAFINFLLVDFIILLDFMVMMFGQSTTPKAVDSKLRNNSNNTSLARLQPPVGFTDTPISNNTYLQDDDDILSSSQPMNSHINLPKRYISDSSATSRPMDRHNNNHRTVSASVKNHIKAINANNSKPIVGHMNTQSPEPRSVEEDKEAEEAEPDHPLKTMTSSSTMVPNKFTRQHISHVQKENAEKFETALQSLLSKYIPQTLLERHPQARIDTTTNKIVHQPSQSILEVEVRHAIATAARNVYHAHMTNEKKRQEFDFEYARLQESFFGRGSVVAGLMRKEAKISARKELNESNRRIANENENGNGNHEFAEELDMNEMERVIKGIGMGLEE